MKKKKDEVVDITTLPKINVVTSSILLNFKNLDRRFKILENMYKTPDKALRLVSREQIIEYAKENKIYVDPEEGKKPNPKDPPVEKKEITPEELAKAAAGVIIDRSIPVMKERKQLLEKIEELKKQKEEAIFLRDNPPPVDPKAKPKQNDKKNQPVNPDDIIIPTVDEMAMDLTVVLYNYPLTAEEYQAMEKEKVNLNHIWIWREVDDLVEEKEEVVLDKNGKPVKPPAKDQKPSNEMIQMQKYFNVPPIGKDPETVYADLLNTKRKSDKLSLLRSTFFEESDFSLKMNEETKKDTLLTFQEDYLTRMSVVNKSYLYYLKWTAETFFQKFAGETHTFSPSDMISIINDSEFKFKDFEHISNGAILYSFCLDLIRTHRKNNQNVPQDEIIFANNDIDSLFDNLEKEIQYEFGKKELLQSIQHSNPPQSIHSNNNLSVKSMNDYVDHNNIISEERMSVHASSHIMTDRARESDQLEKNFQQSDLSSPFKLIIDENDFILKSALDNKVEDLLIADKEKSLSIFRTFPGISRHLMPLLPPIEENKRKAMKCEIYPFLEEGIEIAMYEKYEVINKFEQIFREKIPEQKLDFGDRIYQEVMNREILTQVLNQALMYDTEHVYYYNQRDDNMLLATYYRCPKGRVYRRLNKYRYLSKPDFDNWVKFFRPTFSNKRSESSKGEKENNDNTAVNKLPTPNKEAHNINMPMTMPMPNVLPNPNDNIPKSPPTNRKIPIEKQKTITFGIPYDPEENILYEANDTCIGEVSERIKYMFPTDNGVFIRKVVENGIFSSHSSYVRKDHLIFGIRKNSQNVTEFWLRFENDVLLTCNYKGDYNPYIIGNDAEPTYDNQNGTYITFSLKNGLDVQILPDGDICQKANKNTDTENVKLMDEEMYRIITSKASVVKYFPFDKVFVMYANGNVCHIQNELATNTNNKGYRSAKRLNEGTVYELDPVPVTVQSDPETNTKTLIRDDKVVNIKYPDESALTIHADDTKIFSYPDKLRYLIEHEQFATVEVEFDPVKKRTKTVIAEGSTEALLGSDNLMTRSYDGRMTKIILPDKTAVFTYKEKKATDEFEKCTFNTVTMIFRPDGTVIRIQQDGDICIISSDERLYYNMKGQNLDFSEGQDVDYLFEMNTKPEERKKGVYTVNMQKSKIYTCDEEKNIFEIHADGTAKCKITKNMNLEDSLKKIEEIEVNSPRYETPDFIDEMTRFLDPPENFIPPRLFVIENDNTGYELLNESQVANFKRIKAKDTLHSKYTSQQAEGNFISHYWVTKHKSIAELIQETQAINNIKIPKRLEKITQTPVTMKYPPHEIYLYRNLIESQKIDSAFREKVDISLNNKDQWFSKRRTEFGVLEGPSHIPEVEENIKIQRRILQERQTPDVKFDYDVMKSKLNLNENIFEEDEEGDENENDYFIDGSVLYDIVEHVAEKERRKIIEDRNFRKLPMKFDVPGTFAEIMASIADEMASNVNGDPRSMRSRKKTQLLDTKVIQEMKFLQNFFSSDEGKKVAQLFPRTMVIKKSKKENHKNQKNQNTDNKTGFQLDELAEEEVSPNNIDSLLAGMKMNIELNEENFDIKQQSPIVYLENEKAQGAEVFDPKKSTNNKKKMLPSIHKQQVARMSEIAEKEKQDAENWRKIRTYQFSHDGCSPRQSNPLVPKYLKTTFPEAEFNEDYIYVEKLTDKRIKISSVAKRLYFNAPSVSEVRKSGQHNFLIQALDKKRTYEEMMERLNLMITSELCDPLNKMLKIEPVMLDFGYLVIGNKYEMSLKIRNDDNMTNRVQVRKNLENKFINVECFIGGKISPGETKKVKVSLETDMEIHDKFTEIIEIQTKSFIYKIPVTAMILAQEEFEKLDSERAVKFGARLPCHAAIYKKEFPPIPRKKKKNAKEVYSQYMNKDKNLHDPFDVSPIMKYIQKPRKDSASHSSSVIDDGKLPVI